jgi:hypothetical protein
MPSPRKCFTRPAAPALPYPPAACLARASATWAFRASRAAARRSAAALFWASRVATWFYIFFCWMDVVCVRAQSGVRVRVGGTCALPGCFRVCVCVCACVPARRPPTPPTLSALTFFSSPAKDPLDAAASFSAASMRARISFCTRRNCSAAPAAAAALSASLDRPAFSFSSSFSRD